MSQGVADVSEHKRSLLTREHVSALLVRLAFACVFAINLICAFGFVADPGAYAGSYQLDGVAGEAAVRGLGIAFLMWNVTYPLFIVSPRRFTALGWVILVQQVIGCVGEALILFGLPQTGFEVLAVSIMRFIVFDLGGLVLMGAAFAFFLTSKKKGSVG